MAAGTVSDPTYRQIATIRASNKAGMDALSWLSKWGFDSTLRPLLSSNPYTPPFIPHPSIKHITAYGNLGVYLWNQSRCFLNFMHPDALPAEKWECFFTTITENYKTALNVYKIDKDKLYSLIELYDINFIPAFLLMKNGKEVSRLEGESNLTSLSDQVKKGLKQRA